MKPSDRIAEIARQIIKERKDLNLSTWPNVIDLRVEAISRYLDEKEAES